MKLHDILLFEGINKIPMQKTNQFIYDLVFKHLKGVNAAIAADIKVGFKNDWFWSESLGSFNTVLNSFVSGKRNFEQIQDEAHEAVNDVAHNIIDHYKDKMNHEPDFKPVALTIDIIDNYSSIKNISVEVKNAVDAQLKLEKTLEKAAAAERNAKNTAFIKNITQEMLIADARLIDKHWDKAWGDFLTQVNKDPTKEDLPSDLKGRASTVAELRAELAKLPNWKRDEDLYTLETVARFMSPKPDKAFIERIDNPVLAKKILSLVTKK
jgi:hypothetical protein